MPRGKLSIIYVVRMNEGLPQEIINSPTDGSYKVILDPLLCSELSIPPHHYSSYIWEVHSPHRNRHFSQNSRIFRRRHLYTGRP